MTGEFVTVHQVYALRRRHTDAAGASTDEVLRSSDCLCPLGADHEYVSEIIPYTDE